MTSRTRHLEFGLDSSGDWPFVRWRRRRERSMVDTDCRLEHESEPAVWAIKGTDIQVQAEVAAFQEEEIPYHYGINRGWHFRVVRIIRAPAARDDHTSASEPGSDKDDESKQDEEDENGEEEGDDDGSDQEDDDAEDGDRTDSQPLRGRADAQPIPSLNVIAPTPPSSPRISDSVVAEAAESDLDSIDLER